jgi:hypothetical protein
MKPNTTSIPALLLSLLFPFPSVPAMSDDHDAKSSQRPPPFDIQLGNSEDRATVVSHRDSTPESEAAPSKGTESWSIEITSPRGIGRIVLTRREEHWPATLRLRWKLKAMESIRCTINDTHYEGFVEKRTRKTHWSRRVAEGDATELKSDSTEWSEILITGTPEGREASIPLQESEWMELKLPKAWLANQPDSIAFDWVDFHR